MTLEPTVAAPPSTQTVASQFLASMAALSGVLTDYNSGSQVRAVAESLGSVVEQQSIWTQALAFQALAYGAMTVLNISPYAAFPSVGQITISTAASSPYPTATQNINIPAGTLVQTTGGVQFTTTANAILTSGATGVTVPATAVQGGIAGNVPVGAITQIVTGLLYPLFVTNATAFSGGTNAEQLAATLARFSAAVAAIGLSSPVAIANAAIGVTNAATSEQVLFSTLFEPWIAAGSGAGSGVAGWTLYIDNGTGGARSGLISNVITKLNGNAASGLVGYRDAGVPYVVSGVTPTFAVVNVSGTASSLTTDATLQTLINQAVSGYFILQFGASAQQAVLAQNVGNAVLGLTTSLAVSLYASGSSTALSSLTPTVTGRVVLGQINYALS